MKRFCALVAGTAMLVLPSVASAQMTTMNAGTGAGMYTVEAYVAQYWLDKSGLQDRPKAGGFGGRVTFGAPYMPSGQYFSRPSFGLFATYTAAQQIFGDRDARDVGFTPPDVSTLHVGGELDWKLLPEPAGGVVDPFIGVGAGLFRIKTDAFNSGLLNFSSSSETSNKFALTPAIGANFTIQKGMSIGVRGDLRDVIIFSREQTDYNSGNKKTTTSHNYVAEGGLSFTF